jgi:aryl-alcohol dehydrogenase-like predicted oxidoreductase
LRYVISNPAVSTAIPGAKSPQQAAANAAAGASLLTQDELAALRG